MSLPRVLIITRNLPPLVGGMERLNWHMANELSKNADITVIGPKGSSSEKPQQAKIQEAPLKPLPIFLVVSFLKGIWSSWKWRPDIVIAGSGLTAPLALIISKLCGADSAAYLHGFDITVNHGLYRKLWRPSFKKLDKIIVNSTPTKALAIEAGASPEKIITVYPGVTIPERPQPESEKQKFRKQYGLEGKKVLLSVGRLTTRKGLKEFVKLSLPSIVKAIPECILVVIGETPQHSLGAGLQSMESIMAEADNAGIGDHIIFLGVITDKRRLATAYEISDVHVFPVRDIPDDPEGFGMVAIEAAAHGLPTVAFSTGGIIDAVKNECSGHLVDKGDYQELSSKVISTLSTPLDNQEIRAFAQQFDWPLFGEAIAQTLLNKHYRRD